MIYELFVKLFGAGIVGLIQFLPFTLIVDDTSPMFKIETSLTAPVTREAQQLVENGMILRIQYEWSLIVNDQRAYHQIVTHELRCKDSTWFVDGTVQKILFDSLQLKLGRSAMILPGLRFDNGDKLTIFTKAAILPDSAFTRSTRMRTDVLWNFYTPKRKEILIFNGERFSPE
jgi:hypothetical protein